MKNLKNRDDQKTQPKHGASTVKLSNLLLKFGLTCTLLPYVGEWKEWHKIMNLACSQTRRVWMDSFKGYQCLNKSIDWRTHKYEIEEVFMKKFNSSLQITEKTNLFLIASCSSDVSFILETSKLRFPKMNKFELWKVDSLPIYSLNRVPIFLKNCSQGKINELVINSDLPTDITPLKEGLGYIISNTIKLIKFENLYINQDTLKIIFSSLREAKLLKLTNWMVDIKSDFKIDSNKCVELETLDLRRSWKKHSNVYINSNKLRILISALSNTTIKDSLKKLQWKSNEYPHQEITQILLEFDFKCIVSQN